MIEYLLVSICACLASFMTFFSGFGLGTILMPVVALFFPVPVAIALTAIVHLFHNVFKSLLFWKKIDWSIAFRFGSWAIIGAAIGAWMLKLLSVKGVIWKYTFFAIHGEISFLHLAIGLLLFFFATAELFPGGFLRIKNLAIGGLISGFFGGLSGNQGAIRSVFLVNASSDKDSFIGTNAIIASFVDVIRLTFYWFAFEQLYTEINQSLIVLSIASAMAGIFLGKMLLPKVTVGFIQKIIVVLLYLFGGLFIAGVI